MKTPPIVLLGGVVRILDIAISIAKFEVGSYNIVTFCYDYEYYAICFGGGLIMHNAEKLTCDAIYRFILFELSDKINEAIFAKSSIEEVGHLMKVSPERHSISVFVFAMNSKRETLQLL